MTINKATFAKIHQVSRAAITLAVKSGALVEDEHGMIDERHPKTQQWVERRKAKGEAPVSAAVRPAARKEKAARVVSRPAPEAVAVAAAPVEAPDIDELPDDEDGLSYEDMGALSIAKMRAEIRFKHEQADTALQKRMERLGQLVDRELVARAFARLGSEIKTRLIELPQRSAASIVALVKSGKREIEIQHYLEEEISRALLEIKTRSSEFVLEEPSATVEATN